MHSLERIRKFTQMTTTAGTAGDDTLTGSGSADGLIGNLGNDTISGSAGNDTIYGDLGIGVGSGVVTVPGGATNSSIQTAINIDGAYVLDGNANIDQSTVSPHVTVQATGNNTVQYYAVTLQAGTVIALDIDNTASSTSFTLDTVIQILDGNGAVVATNDDSLLELDPGSTDGFDSALTFTVPSTGTYYIAVGTYGEDDNGIPIPSPIFPTMTYELHVSISGEQTAGGGDDALTGGAGDDLIIGGAGSDTAHYQGNRSDYVATGSAGDFTIADQTPGRDGTDTVRQVEFVHFADGTVTAASLFAPVCFLGGTMIRTPLGETAVDELAIGDCVMTADGRVLPVRFIGRQTIVTRFADAVTSQPICISAGALGENVPTRDLHTSPGHAMLIDGILAIAGALVNGTSIRRMERMPERFTYFHIELDEHAVIFAEGAATESYCDNVPRDVFDNAATYKALYPNAKPIQQLDLPTAKSVRQLPARIRERLDERAVAIGAQPEPSLVAA